ncbi:MAG TPA: FHA domain-containing protein [Planctomycetota bacterium]|nr:FHA domain-containing protein [Planctomycetota bacterium]
MKCPKCGHENKPDAEICAICKSVKFVRAGGGHAAPQGKKHLLTRVGAPPLILDPGKDFTFGRHPSCSFTIPSPRVSREHAVISWEGQTPVLSDKGSSNGTFVKGKRISGKQPLTSGDEIEVGPFTCVYKFEEPRNAAESVPADMQTITEQGDLLSGAIGDTGLAEVLQGLEFNTKSGTLAVFSKQGDGWLTVDKGVPIAAEAGEGLKDDEAVIFLLMLKQGRFTFSPEAKEKTRRIKPTITGLLLEWGRRADEKSGHPEA